MINGGTPIEVCSVSLPTVLKNPGIMICTRSKSKNCIKDIIETILSIDYVIYYINYNTKLENREYLSMFCVCFEKDTKLEDILETLEQKLKTIKGITYKLIPSREIVSDIYVIDTLPALRLFEQSILPLNEYRSIEYIRGIVAMFGEGAKPILRTLGKHMGNVILQDMAKYVGLHPIDCKSLLELVCIYLNSLREIPCSKIDVKEDIIEVKFPEGVPEDIRECLKHYVLGVLEALFKKIGYEVNFNVEEELVLVKRCNKTKRVHLYF
ncbi:MAG: hypothetical protein ACXQTI_07585 [Candidatus Nezhaarchaeales archaeon]